MLFKHCSRCHSFVARRRQSSLPVNRPRLPAVRRWPSVAWPQMVTLHHQDCLPPELLLRRQPLLLNLASSLHRDRCHTEVASPTGDHLIMAICVQRRFCFVEEGGRETDTGRRKFKRFVLHPQESPFRKTADLGKGAIPFRDTGHSFKNSPNCRYFARCGKTVPPAGL